MRTSVAAKYRAPRETDCGIIGSAELFGPWRRPMSASVFWTETMIELPGVREGGMSGQEWAAKARNHSRVA